MRKSTLRRRLILSIVALTLCLSNMIRFMNNTQIRAVEVCSYIAFGIALGALISAVAGIIRARRAGEVV